MPHSGSKESLISIATHGSGTSTIASAIGFLINLCIRVQAGIIP